GELLNFRFSRCDDGVATHAGADGWKTRIERLVRGEVAVEAVHLQSVHVDRVAERDRLNRTVPFLGRSTTICREHGGQRRYTYEAGHCKPSASQVHPRLFV